MTIGIVIVTKNKKPEKKALLKHLHGWHEIMSIWVHYLKMLCEISAQLRMYFYHDYHAEFTI